MQLGVRVVSGSQTQPLPPRTPNSKREERWRPWAWIKGAGGARCRAPPATKLPNPPDLHDFGPQGEGLVVESLLPQQQLPAAALAHLRGGAGASRRVFLPDRCSEAYVGGEKLRVGPHAQCQQAGEQLHAWPPVGRSSSVSAQRPQRRPWV